MIMGQYSLLRVIRYGPYGLLGEATIISTDEQAEEHIGPVAFMLDYYRELREHHSVQESMMLADKRWCDVVANPELERILNQLRLRRLTESGGKDE